jgi:pimeloyl-ACP methyl ester carboxylesterase
VSHTERAVQAPTEITLDTPDGRLAGLAWRRSGAPRLLALHGWLDNAASFLPLAPLLECLDLVALDLPGHGRSGHRPAGARYHFVDYPFAVDAALDALGWPDAHLLGHSMGAAIAATYGAGAAERVRSLIMLDSLGPLTAATDTAADRLRRSLRKNRQGPGATRRYASVEDMVKARQAASGLDAAAARLLCARAARRDGDGWTWRSDPALNWVSPLLMTEEQVLDLLRHIEAPVLTWHATPESPWFSPDKVRRRLAAIAHGRHLDATGGHHFHMEDPASIAATMVAFIVEHDCPPKERTNHDRAEPGTDTDFDTRA